MTDPTRPAGWSGETAPVTGTAPPPVFRVTLIKLAPSLRLAVVNGRSVRVGDEVDGARVVSIARDGVQLDHGGERIRVATPSVAATAGLTRTAETVE